MILVQCRHCFKRTTMKITNYIFIMTIAFVLSGCTQIITAPISAAGAVVGAAVDIAGAAGGAVVNTVKGGNKK